jgi:predicted DNA-binding transcriptional regulator YafY
MPGPRSKLRASYQLVSMLLDGEALDRELVAKTLEVNVAAADAHIKAMTDSIRHLETERSATRRRTVRLRPGPLGKAPSVATAVAASLGSALAKLFRGSAYEQGLRTALAHVIERFPRRGRFQDIDRKFLFVTQGGEAALPELSAILDDVVDGLLGHHVLRVTYAGFNGAQRRRVIEPLSLAIYQHQLYLVGREAGERTVLRFARISKSEATAGRFTYPSKAEYDPDAIFRDSLGIFVTGDTAPIRVQFRLDQTWSHYAQSHRWHASQQVQKDPSGGVTVTLTVRHCRELEQLLLGFGEHVEVLGPPALKQAVEARVLAAADQIKRRDPASARSIAT